MKDFLRNQVPLFDKKDFWFLGAAKQLLHKPWTFPKNSHARRDLGLISDLNVEILNQRKEM